MVSAVVDKYGLREDFAARLDIPPEIPAGNGFISGPFKRKKSIEVLPFPLDDRARYLIVKKIVEAANNPYLAFAGSPDEIVLSKFLFAMNPNIRPELLEERHFETLMLAELARDRLNALYRTLEDFSARTSAGSARKNASKKAARVPESVRSALNALRRQINALKEFIDYVENPDSKEGEKWPEK